MPSNPTSRASAAAAALAVLVLGAGCSLLPGRDPDAESSATSTPPETASSTPTADVGDVVLDGDYGAQKTGGQAGQDLSVTLTGVHRISDEVGLVSVRIDAQSQSLFNYMFSEPLDGDASTAFSDVTITDDGDPTLYQSVRDGAGHCLCSSVGGLSSGASVGAWAYVSLPKGASTVNVTVGPLQPWVGVPVS